MATESECKQIGYIAHYPIWVYVIAGVIGFAIGKWLK